MIMQNELCMEWAIWGETYKEWAISVISYQYATPYIYILLKESDCA